MKPDPFDPLGQRLFEAARQEPLPRGALERAVAAARRERASVVSGSRSSRRTAAILWFAAAALCAGAVWFARVGERTSGIRAEPPGSVERSRVSQQFSPPSPAREVADAVPSATIVARPANPAPRQAPAVPSAPATLTDEISSLQIASDALSRGDAHAALVALDHYDHMAGQKKMGAEATLLRVEALSRAGQQSAASTLAKRFVERNPESPLVDRVRSFVQK